MNRIRLATNAVRRAATLRARLGYGPADAVCAFDIARELGIDVRFLALASLEGAYSGGDPPVILINSLRPSGRRRFTCGHELGHDEYDHGMRFDSVADKAETRVEEFLANGFSRALLMPKLAVASAYARRRWSTATTTAQQAFVVAQDLGVGFTTLLDQMSLSLRLIDRPIAERLRRARLQRIRAAILATEVEHDLFPVDQNWGSRPLDVDVGDTIFAPNASRFYGSCAEDDGGVLRAKAAGLGELVVPGRPQPIAVRVSRRGFTGLALYRHLEDPSGE